MMNPRNQGSMAEDIHSLFHRGAMGAWADGKLVSHFISEEAGCQLAFRVLIHRHGPMVLTLCRRVLGDSHAAEDAFQATFLALIRKAGTIRDQAVLSGWLYRVALRVSKKAKAQAARRQFIERQAVERSNGMGDEQERAETRSLIQEEIARLPERYREPIVLCYLEGLHHHEIAERLECPVGTVESRLSRGRERLRSRLERRGLAPIASVPGIAMIARNTSFVVPNSLIEATIRYVSDFGSRKVASQVLAGSIGLLGKGSAWQFGHSLPVLIACAGMFVAGLSAFYSWAPAASVEPSPLSGSMSFNLPTDPSPDQLTGIRPDPEKQSAVLAPNPLPSLRPSRPDSAIAIPLKNITIDGQLDDWPKGMDRHPIRRRLMNVSSYDSTTKGPGAVPEANFWVGYDRVTSRIYLAVEVEDEDLIASAGDHLHSDAVEVYVEGLFSDRSVPVWELDATKLPVIQYAAIPGRLAAYGDPKGANPSLLYGKVANSTTKMNYHRSGNKTTYEWAIQAFNRYPDEPTQLEPGQRIGFEVVVVDKDRDRPKPTWIHWGPAYKWFKGMDAGTLGELILIDSPSMQN